MRRRRRRTSVLLPLLPLLAAAFALGWVLSGHLTRAQVHAATPSPSPHPSRLPAHLPRAWLLDVPAENQYPLLPNGCEVTSLSMLLGAVGHPVSPLTLARLLPYDPTPRVLAPDGAIVSWGNPEVGFVGSIWNAQDGYGVYHRPIVRLLNRILPGEAVDLTGRPFRTVEAYVAAGRPVMVWTTITLRPTHNWVTWQSPEGPVRATLEEHAVLIVGYDSTQVLIDNPDGGLKAQAVPLSPFLASWRQMGQQAVTVALPERPPLGARR